MCSLIWKSKLHERLKLFLWKLCCDVLPFGSRLQSIFGKTPGPCMLCGQSEGDDVHHFLSICTVTQHLWFASQWNFCSSALNFSSGRELVQWLHNPSFRHLLSKEESQEFFLYGTLLYHKLWMMRNEMYHQGTPLDLSKLQKQVKDGFIEHRSLLQSNSGSSQDLGSVEKVRWGLPRPGRIKGYVDFAKSNEEGAVAAVFFDPSGSVLAFGAKKVSVSSMFQGELEAMRFGVDLATRLHLGGLCIFSDNLHLVQSVMAKSCPFWNLHLRFSLSLVLCIRGG
ncbi:hypothetical protein F8388_006720 [Cannabis sativa]|uniref:Reverse transcriptase zinc-binding domain-containing protein n=1 Tax=Cannabis sativa TaxID=3483 RepID=A0A7J6GV34_CANSA|nr:hypothetical protein F8388_006720 [Cannabis sativa]KAF4397848.1 hypothetical protein G4B88_019569 [Cannabis sativa]